MTVIKVYFSIFTLVPNNMLPDLFLTLRLLDAQMSISKESTTINDD